MTQSFVAPFCELLGHFGNARGPMGAKIGIKILAQRWVIDRPVNYPPLAHIFGPFFGALGALLGYPGPQERKSRGQNSGRTVGN